ncbi:MAG: hypothetical protein IT207_08725 [Fimbriimonadaceae bacterium]|nr:hypothetical protein [Fimbriimonadaceae bacterium]
MQAGLIRSNAIGNDPWFLTAAGHDRAERLDDIPSKAEGFLIRRSKTSKHHDLALKALVKLGRGLPKISAVWAEAHNEKIDDRIFRKIKEGAFVVVDVPRKREKDLNEESHNVGLEQGYALALGRPMIHIQYLAKGQQLSLPFDIQSHNCLAYGPGAGQNAGAVFQERVRLALEANRLAVPLLSL